MESSIEMLAAISFFVIGISHIVQPRCWAAYFVLLREQGSTGIFIVAMMTLPMGVLIVSFHNVWTGHHAVLTLIGWGYCLKSFVYLTYPRAGIAALSKISVEKANKFVVAGIFLVGMSGLCWYSWFTGP